MLESLRCGVPLLGRFGEHFGDEILALLRHVIEGGEVEVEFALFHGLDYFIAIGSVKRGMATQENVEDNSDGPNVALVIILAQEHLWSNVVGSTLDCMHFLLEEFGDPEVGDLEDSLLVEEDVLGLEISMDDVLGVQIVDRF